MKIIMRKAKSATIEGKFVAKRSMGAFAVGSKRSVTVKSHSKDSYVVKAKVIR